MKSYIDILLEAVITEATAPPEGMAGKTFYHGTRSAEAAKGILRNGLQPPEQTTRGGHLAPVQGMVYMTPSLGYALIYAAGGSYIGNPSYRIPYRGANKEKFEHILKGRDGSEQRYGYVFEFNGADLNAVQPDEDQVGEIYHYMLCGREPNPQYCHPEFMHAWDAIKADGTRSNHFKWHMDNWTTDRQKYGIKDGMYSQYAAGGKRALKQMSNDMKAWLVSIGLHVAHQGAVKPTACWKFDKTKIGWLEKNGANLHEIAKKVL